MRWRSTALLLSAAACLAALSQAQRTSSEGCNDQKTYCTAWAQDPGFEYWLPESKESPHRYGTYQQGISPCKYGHTSVEYWPGRCSSPECIEGPTIYTECACVSEEHALEFHAQERSMMMLLSGIFVPIALLSLCCCLFQWATCNVIDVDISLGTDHAISSPMLASCVACMAMSLTAAVVTVAWLMYDTSKYARMCGD